MPEEQPKLDAEVKPKPEAEPDDVSDADAEVTKNRPAIYTDAFLVSVIEGGAMFRITFAEGTAKQIGRIRAAVLMPRDDAKELARILSVLLSRTEKEEAPAAQIKSTGL